MAIDRNPLAIGGSSAGAYYSDFGPQAAATRTADFGHQSSVADRRSSTAFSAVRHRTSDFSTGPQKQKQKAAADS